MTSSLFFKFTQLPLEYGGKKKSMLGEKILEQFGTYISTNIERKFKD